MTIALLRNTGLNYVEWELSFALFYHIAESSRFQEQALQISSILVSDHDGGL